jgi:hypothetical protein
MCRKKQEWRRGELRPTTPTAASIFGRPSVNAQRAEAKILSACSAGSASIVAL